jgi:hypothetical protein
MAMARVGYAAKPLCSGVRSPAVLPVVSELTSMEYSHWLLVNIHSYFYYYFLLLLLYVHILTYVNLILIYHQHIKVAMNMLIRISMHIIPSKIIKPLCFDGGLNFLNISHVREKSHENQMSYPIEYPIEYPAVITWLENPSAMVR